MQFMKPFRGQAVQQVSKGKVKYIIDKNGPIFRQFQNDEAIQRRTPAALQYRLLHHVHYLVIANYPGRIQMCN